METKMNLFHKYEYKNKIKLFFSNIKLKFQPRSCKTFMFNSNCSVLL